MILRAARNRLKLRGLSKISVISTEQMRQWEKASWDAGKKESDVIQNAGSQLAARILQLTRPNDKIWILAGKGHNGDDARAAQPHLAGREVVLTSVENPKHGLSDFTAALKDRDPEKPLWIIDALFGIGLDRPLDPDWQALVTAINAADLPVVAVDVPSGLNADTGKPEGAAVEAAITLTLGAPKKGLLLGPAFTGRVEVISNVGLAGGPPEAELKWTLPSDFAGLPPRRPVVSNKGDFGHVAIVAGSLGYHGAAVLCAIGARRAHPGLVSVYAQELTYGAVATQLQSAMVHPWRDTIVLPKNCSSILVGPGLAAENLPSSVKGMSRDLWRTSPISMVVDASAIEWLEQRPPPHGAVRVITPHPGEAARTLHLPISEVQGNRVAVLRKLSERFFNCIVVLKGHQTLIGRATGDIFVNNSGNPFLAQGGSGDLLAGYIAGLLAQPEWRRDAMLAVRYAVWQHGAAADHLNSVQPNWTVEDLGAWIGRIPPAGLE